MPSMGNSQSQPGDGDNDHANFVNQDPEPIEENPPQSENEEIAITQKVKRRKKKRSKKADKERVNENENDDDDDEKGVGDNIVNEGKEQEKIKAGGKSMKNEKEKRKEDDDIEDVVTVATTTTTTTTTKTKTTTSATSAGTEKSKRKKKNRQTSQEEESAQALLALNKGLQEVNSVADGDTVVVAAEGENSPNDPEQVEGADDGDGQDEPKKKKRRGNRKTSKISKTISEEEILDTQATAASSPAVPPQTEEPVPSSPINNNNNLTDTSHTANPATQAEDISLLQYTDLQHHSLHEIPDSDRIISQHLAAHMSKHNPIPQSNIPDLQDVLMGDELTGNEFDADLASLVSPLRHANKAKASTSYKRKRLPEDDANKLVDPALRALDAAAGQDDETDETGGDKTKRKRRIPAEGILPPAPVAAKRPPRARKPAAAPTIVDGTSGAGASGNGGTFTLDERHAIDKHLSEYMAIHKLTHADLCSRVWSNDRKKDDFWESVCGVLPNRSRASIYKHVRRSYHVFQQRAKWTAEDDEELARLVAEKGSSWKDVGDAMGRMGEDCRDRWRNYVKCGKDRGRDRWGEDEEAELRRVLKTVLSNIRASKGSIVAPEEIDLDADEVEGEEEINWTSVSELMGNKRSRIQCRYKWNKMKQQRARVTGAPPGESRSALWKKRKVKLNVEEMKVGDKVWILEQIRESQAKEEKSIPWDNIGEQSALWSARDLERGYKAMRAHLPHRRLPLHEIISRLLSNLNELPLEVRTERYQPHSMQPTPTPAQQQSGYDFVHHQEHHTTYPLHNPAPVVAMNSLTGDLDTNEYTHHQHGEMDMVDPALIGQGGISSGVQQDLEKTAGEAILIAQAAAAAAHAQEAEVRGLENMIEEEGETERELRRRLGV